MINKTQRFTRFESIGVKDFMINGTRYPVVWAQYLGPINFGPDKGKHAVRIDSVRIHVGEEKLIRREDWVNANK